MLNAETKYLLFISSTYKDLIKAREEVIKVILNMYHIPIGMEMFSANNAKQWETIKETISKSDYYILIVGHRYGSETEEGISFTEKEFDYAKQNNIPIYAYVRKRDIRTLPEERDDEKTKLEKLDRFIKKVENHGMIQYWEEPAELGQKVAISIVKAFKEAPGIGWVRRDVHADSQIGKDLDKSGVIRIHTDARSLQQNYNEYFAQNGLTKVDIIHCWGNTWNENNRDNIRKIAKNNVKVRVVLLNNKSAYIKPLATNLELKTTECITSIKKSLSSWEKLIQELKTDKKNKIKIEVYLTEDLPSRAIYRFGDYIISADRNFMRRKTVNLNSFICRKNESGLYNNILFEIDYVIKNAQRVF